MQSLTPLFLLLAAPAAAAPARAPYLEGVTRDSAFVCWRTPEPTQGIVGFSRAGSGAAFPERRASDDAARTDHCVRLDALEASTTYAYRIAAAAPGDREVWSAEHAFETAEGPQESRLRFAAFGDSGYKGEGQTAVARRLEAAAPSFILLLGDVVYPGGDDAAYDQRYFDPYGSFLDRICVYPVAGNHDYGNQRLRPRKGRAWLRDNFSAIHRTPAASDRTYYSFDRGPAHFTAVDANRVYPISGAPAVEPGSDQWRWLDADLAASTAPWKFVFMHEAPYSSGHHGTNEALVKWLTPLFEKHRVDVVFAGHDHDYERTYPLKGGRRADDGVVYVVAGIGGARLSSRYQVRPRTAAFEERYGFVLAVLDGRRLRLEAIGVDGRPFDAWEKVK